MVCLQKNGLAPYEVFNEIKNSVNQISREEILRNKENLSALISKVLKTGQVDVAKNLLFNINAMNKELLWASSKLNFDKYVERDLLLEYIDKCEDRSVVIQYLENFPRDIPDTVVEKIHACKEENIFDTYIVVFTDYTGEVRSKIQEDNREKDPIVFGMFCDLENKEVYNRLYFIDDWEDEFCDLTLEKLIEEHAKISNESIVGSISEDNQQELIRELEQIANKKEKSSGEEVLCKELSSLSFFQKLKILFFKKGV